MLKIKLHMLLALGAFLAIACSGDPEPVQTNSSGSGVNKSDASCCLNGSFYDCGGDGDAATKCFNDGSPGSCESDSDNNDKCKSSSSSDSSGSGDSSGGDIDDDFGDL